MFDIGWSEILVIAIVMVVVVGPKDLPRMLRAFGRATAKFRAQASEFRRNFDEALKEAELDDVRDILNDARGLDPRNSIRKALSPLAAAGQEIKASIEDAANVTRATADEILSPKPQTEPESLLDSTDLPAADRPAPRKRSSKTSSKTSAASKTSSKSKSEAASSATARKTASAKAKPNGAAKATGLARANGASEAHGAKKPTARRASAKAAASVADGQASAGMAAKAPPKTSTKTSARPAAPKNSAKRTTPTKRKVAAEKNGAADTGSST